MTKAGWVRVGKTAVQGIVLSFAVVAIAGCCGKPKPKKAFGEACTDVFDCESLDCAAHGKFCTKNCTYDSECTAPQVCRGEPTGTGSACATKEGTAVGAACMDREDCDHGSCLKHVGADDDPGICSMHCNSANDCPAGSKTCESISDSAGTKFCLPGAGVQYGTPASKKVPAKTGAAATTHGATPPGGRPPAATPPKK